MNSKVVEKKKANAKRKYSLTQSELDTYGIWYCSSIRKFLKAWAWRCRIHFISPAQLPRQIWEGIIQQHSDVCGIAIAYGYYPETHMKRIWWAQKFIWHSYMINPDEELDEPRWRSLRTQQHFEVHNVYLEFQVKACGAQNTWHNTIGHLTTTIWAQKLYK